MNERPPLTILNGPFNDRNVGNLVGASWCTQFKISAEGIRELHLSRSAAFSLDNLAGSKNLWC